MKLDHGTKERILRKLQDLKGHPLVFTVLEPLTGMEPATHRLRIGDYRLVLQRDGDDKFLVVKVGHRSTIYE